MRFNEFSWTTKDDNGYHKQRTVAEPLSTLTYFLKLFFDENVKWIHLEKGVE